MKKYVFSFLFIVTLIFPILLSAQGATCGEVEPFCSDFGASFPASTNTTAEPGNQYGCLFSQPNPAWYYLQIDSPGYLEITLTNSNNVDVDFIVYGPYPNIQAAQANCGSFQAQETNCSFGGTCLNGVPCNFFNGCVNGDGVDCSYDPQAVEVADIPDAQTGEVYVFLITNFSGQPTEIFVNQTGGSASTDCSIVECRTVSFLQNTPGGLDLLPTTIDCTDQPLDLVARPGNMPEPNGFITPAFGVQIFTDAAAPFQNSLEIYNGPDGTGDLLGYWAPADMGGSYLGQVEGDSDFIGFGEYLDPTLSYSFVWCDLAQTGLFEYEVINYALDEAPNNVLAMGNLNNNGQECITVNFGAPTGTATFTGDGITDTGTGRATFDPSGLAPGTYTITYSWDDGDNCSGSESQTIEVTCDEDCVRSGGQVVGPTTLELCAEDPPYILETMNEITDPAALLPDVLWAVWVLDDPLNVTAIPGGGPPPDDQFQSDDNNYIGVWNNGPGQIVFGTSIELIPDGSGVTYYIAPLIGQGASGQFDTDCTGLDPDQGYIIYMNPPLSTNVNVNNCNIQVDLTGGFPLIDNAAEYSWSYTTPAGQTVTGTGTPVNVVGGTDGNYTFSITNDGNDCDLLNFATVTLNGCNCTADAGTFAVNSTTVCYDNLLEIISSGDYTGSFEDGTFGDNAPGDGDMYNGVGYAMFSQPPSGVYFPDDPNFIGLIGTSPTPAGVEELGTLGVNTIVNGTPVTPGSTFFFTTVYSFDVDDNLYGVDLGADGSIDCFDSNPDQAIAVTFLDSISAVVDQVCNANGGVDITFELSGGNPEFNGSSYTVTGDGLGGTVSAGGTYTITDHAPGAPYIIVVGDEGGQGCSRTFGGTSLSVPTVEMSSTDADCDGNAVGTATATPGSGSGIYSFDWSNNGNTSTITGLVPDTYTVTVTDDLGCSVTGEVEVGQPLGDLSVVAVADSVSCNMGDDGSITAEPSGGTEPYTYQWSTSPAGTQTLGGLSTGTYTVTVLDANGCQASSSAEIEQPTVLGAFLDNVVNPTCFGESNGSIEGVPTGGTPPFTFTWSNGQMTDIITDLPVGFYGLTITDSNGCDAFASTTLSEPALLTFSTNVDADASCEGSMDGQISTATGGGTIPYTYTWSHDATLDADVAPNLNPGNYTVTVTDDQGCVATAFAFVASTVIITDAGTTIDVGCNGESTGSINANPAGSPNLPYTYTWSANANTGNSQTAAGLPADAYSVTIVDAAGCSTIAQYVINEPTELLIGATVDNDILCNGDDNGQASVTAAGGTPDALSNYNYQWSASANNQNTATATNLPAGTHGITVTDDNGCMATAEIEIIEPPVLNLIIGSSEVSCTGGNDGFVTATPQGGTPDAAGNYDYQWSPNAGGQTTATIFNLTTDTYMVTVTDANGCTVIGEATVTEPTELLVNTVVDNNVSCNSGNDGQATATASGGSLEEFNPDADYEYQWSASAGDQTTATATNLPAGIHTISVTDFKGCLTTAEVTITEPTAVIVDIIIDNNVNCNGGNDAQATATASGGTPDILGNYIYQWSANAGSVNSPTAMSLPTGTYTITVTDGNGCTGINSVEIVEPNALALTVTNDMNVSCNGGNDGAATATPSGGTPDLNGNYTYEWSASAGGFVTPTVTTLPAGTHTVTVTDDNGCTITGSVDISEPDELTVSVDLQNNVSCSSGNDGAVIANPSGGTPNAAGNYTYQWSPSTGGQATQLANNLLTGTHNVTVTDDNGCTVTGSIDITEPTALGLTITVDEDVNCGGGMDGQATAAPTGGTPDVAGNYNYQWSASASDQTTATATNLPAGTHTITVTDDNGCEISGTVTVAEPPVLSVDIDLVNNVNCGGGMDGEATAVPAGGTPDAFGNYTYQWSASASSQVTAIASNLPAGTHTITVTDANGCTATNSIDITEPVPVTTGIDITPVSCNGGMDGSATANPAGGTPNPDGTYNYQWSANAGGVFTQTASGLAAGTYTVVVTDANGCATPPINVTVPEPAEALTLAISGQDPSCNSGTDGTATVDPTGGTPSYTYEWSASAGSQMTQTALNIPAGTHAITVTDLNGCTETAEITIGEPEALDLTLTPTDPACFGELTGSIAAAVTGGTMPYTYAWSDGQITETATNLPQGNHSVFVTDANGCMISDNLTLTAPPEILLDINTQLTSCVGSCDGTASVLATGGAGGFTYEWDNGETTDVATALCPGPHTVTVTDATGCEVVGNLTINGPTPIFPGGAGPTPVSCFGGNDGTITIEPTGGTPSYTYEWSADGMSIGSDSGASSTITDLAAGIYTVVITDANGCSTPPINITVVEPLFPLTLDASGEGPSCNGGDDGFVTVEPEGGTPSYAYQWSAETGFQDTQTALNLAPGTYTVTVSDAGGCTETAEVSIDEPSAVDFELSSMPATCFGDANGVIIVENATGGMPPYTYSVDNEIFRMDSTIFGLVAGLYTVYVQDASGCVFTDEVLVEQPFEVIVDAGPDVEILFGDSIQLSAQINQPPGNDFVFSWSPAEGLIDCMGCDEPYAMPSEDMTYIVTAIDSITGCSASDDIRVNVNKDRNVFIPNVFSPDGDGTNDIFMIFGGQGVVEVLSFRVYDRWGELMFEDSNFMTNDPAHGWDGTFRGRDLNPGVFVFAAEVEFIDGVRIPYAGDVTLVR